jgi:hypothetical protein
MKKTRESRGFSFFLPLGFFALANVQIAEGCGRNVGKNLGRFLAQEINSARPRRAEQNQPSRALRKKFSIQNAHTLMQAAAM